MSLLSDAEVAMMQGDGYCEDEVVAATEWIAAEVLKAWEQSGSMSHAINDPTLVERQRAAIEDLVMGYGFLPEANAILAKHGLL